MTAFCSNCGERSVSSTGRCVCGVRATTQQARTRPLLAGNDAGVGNKWLKNYTTKKDSASPTSSPVRSRQNTPDPVSPSTPKSSFVRPTSQHQSTASRLMVLEDDDEDGPVLSGVFGSILSPEDRCICVKCDHEFEPEETIYPDPRAKDDPELAQVFYCRPCFAIRWARGSCQACGLAVLTDAPFIVHGEKVWHKLHCFACTYCSEGAPAEQCVIDLAGKPSCNDCFDRGAYINPADGRIPPPSPSIRQNTFAKVPAARAKWGGLPTPPSSAASGKSQKMEMEQASVGLKGWRQEKETHVAKGTWQELAHKFEAVGLAEKRPKPVASTPSAASMPSGSGPRRSPPASTPSTSQLEDASQTPCIECKKPLGNFDTTQLHSGEGIHRSCLSCAACGMGIGSRWVELEAKRYHGSCKPSYSSSTAPTPFKGGTLPSTSAAEVASPKQEFKMPRVPASPTKPPTSEEPKDELCPACSQELGYAAPLSKLPSGEIYHRACLKCDGCGQGLQSQFIQEQGRRYCKAACVPPAPPSAHEVGPTDPCSGCGKQLGWSSQCITTPSAAGVKGWHAGCFVCKSCGNGFEEERGSFVLSPAGDAVHPSCLQQATKASPMTEPKRTPSIRKSTSRAPNTPPAALALAQKISAPLAPVQTRPSPSWREKLGNAGQSPPVQETQLFAKRARPLPNLGGLLVCAGCSVRATEGETRPGPLGRRYHDKCLKCAGCSTRLDSEARVDGDGKLVCEACASRKRGAAGGRGRRTIVA